MPSCHPKCSLLISSGASHKSQAQWLARHPDPTHRLSNHAKNTNGLGQWGPHWLFVASSFPILCTSGATINTGRLCRSVRKVASARTYFRVAAEWRSRLDQPLTKCSSQASEGGCWCVWPPGCPPLTSGRPWQSVSWGTRMKAPVSSTCTKVTEVTDLIQDQMSRSRRWGRKCCHASDTCWRALSYNLTTSEFCIGTKAWTF